MKTTRIPRLASVRNIFGTIIWPRRWRIALGLGLVSINRLCSLVLPGSIRVLVDEVIPDQDMNEASVTRYPTCPLKSPKFPYGSP